MSGEEDLNDVAGWLLIYVILKYIAGVLAIIPIVLLFHVWTMNGHPPSHGLLLPLLLSAVSILVSVAAATAVLHTSRWALQLVGFDLLYTAVALVITAIVGFRNGIGPQQLLIILRTVAQIAVLCAWFQYFRVSRRVHATLGRNLLEDAVEPV